MDFGSEHEFAIHRHIFGAIKSNVHVKQPLSNWIPLGCMFRGHSSEGIVTFQHEMEPKETAWKWDYTANFVI